MKNIKKIVAAFVTASIILVMVITPSFASVYENYENSSTAGWSGNGNQVFNFKTEDNGNQYMEIEYQENGTIGYYDAIREFNQMSGNIVLSFDIKFSENIKDNIFLRKRASGVSDPGVRIYKNWTHVNYYSGGTMYRLINSDISYSKWYSFSITMTTMSSGGVQSITVKERDTGVVVGNIENIPLNKEVDYVNQFVVGSDGTMCIDNLKIYTASINKLVVTGEAYPKIGTSTNVYKAMAVDSNGAELSVPIQWSLKNAVSGVSIDADTGKLTIDSTAKVGQAIVVATLKNSTSKKAYYLIDIEK